jgi:hypothetical protein
MRQRAAPSTFAPSSNLILPLSKDVFFNGNVMPCSTGISSLKNIRSNEWNRLTGIPAIITGSRVVFLPRNLDLVMLKTTQRVRSAADRNRQSSRVPLILAPVWIPSQPSNQEDWQFIQQTWRRPGRTLLLWRLPRRSIPSVSSVGPASACVSEAMTRIARRNGANNPLVTAIQ